MSDRIDYEIEVVLRAAAEYVDEARTIHSTGAADSTLESISVAMAWLKRAARILARHKLKA